MADPVSLAITVALNAAAMAATAMQKIEGPRLTDLSVTVADYGTPLNYIYGNRRVEVPVFYAEPILERRKKRKTKGGKYNEYTYFGTWAVEVADHEIASYKRIWFDRHLVYDANSPGATSIFGLADSYEISNSIAFYYGSEDQMPNERMIATVEAEEGPDTCPAYRGVSYIFFIDIPLEKLGNRFPQVSVEVIASGEPIYPFDTFSTTTPALSQLDNATFSPDYSRFMWALGDDYEIWNVATRSLIRTGTFPTSVPYSSKLGMFNDGRLIISNSQDVYVLRADGSTESYSPNLFPNTTFDQHLQRQIGVFEDGNGIEHWASTPQPTVPYFYVDGAVFEMEDLTGTIWYPENYFVDSYGDVWAIGRVPSASTTTARFYRIIDTGARPGSSGYIIVTGLVDIGGGYGEVAAVHYKDATRDQFVFQWGGSSLYAADINTGAINASSIGFILVPYCTPSQFLNMPPGATSIWLQNREYSLRDLSIIRTVNLASWIGAPVADGIIYDPINNALIGAPDGILSITWRFLDRVDFSGVALQSIIEDASVRAGLNSEDVDATLCTQNVQGYSWTQGSGKDIIGPLLDLYDIDARPHDFGIEFLPRGSASGGAIESEEFAISGADDARFVVTLTSDTDLPRRLFFSFADVDADQQPNTVVCQRPADAISSARDLSIDMTTLAMTPARAADLSNRMFRRIWFSREKAEFGITAMHLGLEPADIQTIGFDGNSITMRLSRVSIGADGVLASKWNRDHPNLALLPGMTGAPASGRPPSVIFAPGPSQGFFLDIPLLDDAHDQTTPLIYLAAGPVSYTDFWSGADISYSDSGIASEYAAGWDGVASSEGCAHGSVLTPLADCLTSVIDYGSQIEIQLLYGELQSVTEAQILADSSVNLAIIGSEIVQFITATLIGPALYRVSGFVRGARGTEQHTGSHDYIEDFLLLDSVVKRHSLGASEIGDTDYYVAGSLGLNPDLNDAVGLTFTAAAHKPYSPAHLAAEYDDYSGEWTISWIRRSRIGGATLNGQNIPLGETSESYKLQILDGAGVVLRTIEQAGKSYVYGIAEQVIDFGAPVTTFAYKVAQQSPALGIDGFYSMAAAEI
jgi:hypothetical protein